MRDIPKPAAGSDHLAEPFKTGPFKTAFALVASATAALEAMPSVLADIRTALATPTPPALLPSISRLYRLVQDAAVDADNLLVTPRSAADSSLMLRVVGRQPSGTIDVRTLEIDREALVLVGRGDGRDPRPLDVLAGALRVAARWPTDDAGIAAIAALDQLGNRVSIGASRLSLVKARLDLQESFLASVLGTDLAAPRTPIESDLDQASAMTLAQAARRLLTTRSLTIAAGNRAVLTSLFRTEPEVGD